MEEVNERKRKKELNEEKKLLPHVFVFPTFSIWKFSKVLSI